MYILRMRDAAYVRDGETIVAPTSLDLSARERMTHPCASVLEAEALAMMAAALARATAGSVTIGEYDPRVQPVHCKRIAAFVPHDPLPLTQIDAERYIAYRAALWDVEHRRGACSRTGIAARLDGMHEAFAYPVVGALVPAPRTARTRPAATDIRSADSRRSRETAPC